MIDPGSVVPTGPPAVLPRAVALPSPAAAAATASTTTMPILGNRIGHLIAVRVAVRSRECTPTIAGTGGREVSNHALTALMCAKPQRAVGSRQSESRDVADDDRFIPIDAGLRPACRTLISKCFRTTKSKRPLSGRILYVQRKTSMISARYVQVVAFRETAVIDGRRHGSRRAVSVHEIHLV